MSAVAWLLGLYAIAAIGWAHARLRADRTRLFELVVLDVVFVALLLAATDKDTFHWLMQEDGPAEWATVFAFVAAAVAWGFQAKSLPRRPVLTLVGYGLLAVFCLFVAGEELSWGQRLFAYRPPDVFLEENFQQELNVHNFLTGKEAAGFELDSRHFVALIAAGWGIGGGWLRHLLSDDERWGAIARLGPPVWTTGFFAAVAWAEVAYPVSLTGEAAELCLGLCFLVAGAEAARSWPRGRAAAVIGAVLLLGALSPTLTAWAFYGSDEDLSAQARSELEELAEALQKEGAIRPKLREKKSIHKRMFTAVQVGYFDLTAPSGDDYFLDPWNNPYWVRWKRKTGKLTLYSFGPDRRRDSKPPDPVVDDIRVVLDL